MSDTPTAPAAWYEDPEDAAHYRYWDGAQWTDHRAPRVAPAAGPAAPAPASALTVAPEAPIRVGPLLAAGALLILAGVGRAVSYLLPYELFGLSLVFSALEVVGWAGTYAAFLVAGYPARRTAPRVLAVVLLCVYLLTGAITLGLTVTPFALTGGFTALVGLMGFLTLGLGIAFGVATARSPHLSSRVKMLPLALYLGILAFGLVSSVVNSAISSGSSVPWQASVVVGGLSGLVPIVAGVLVIAFGRTPNAAPPAAVAPAAVPPTAGTPGPSA